MQKVPIALNVDDPSPIVSVYYDHIPSHLTEDGRPIAKTIPNSFLDKFCDITEKHGIHGKFSVIPQPAGRGDITKGIPGYPIEEMQEWLETVRTRVVPRFSIGAEMLTHHMAIDLTTGQPMKLNEMEDAAIKRFAENKGLFLVMSPWRVVAGGNSVFNTYAQQNGIDKTSVDFMNRMCDVIGGMSIANLFAMDGTKECAEYSPRI